MLHNRCLLLAIILLAVWFLPLADDLEFWSVDHRFQWRGSRPPLPDTILVGIDAASIAWAKRPTSIWNPLFAEFLRAMSTASASTVMLDLVFKTSLDGEIRSMVGNVLKENGASLPVPLLNKIGFDRPLIKALIETRNTGMKVILGFVADPNRPADLNIVPELRVNIPQEYLGFLNIDMAPDQVVRSATLYGRNIADGAIFPSADIAVAAARLGTSFKIASDGTPMLGDRPIRNLAKGREGKIDYIGPKESFPYESFKEVLIDAREHPERLNRFKGKTVLVGFWMIEDNKLVPFYGFMPGIEIHANILENLVNDRFLQVPPSWLQPLVMVMLLAIQFFAFGRGIKTGLITTFILGGIWTAATLVSFSNASFLLPFSRPILLIFGIGLVEAGRLFLAVENERKLVKSVFQRYVNDAVLEMILKTPHEEIMKGARRQICVMFSDIRGFTTFSESRSPHEIVTFLNLYLTGLTDIVLRHDGVVDKFLGDGMMAFFNAPVDRPGYAHEAVEAALEMREFIKKTAIRVAAGAFDLKIGIALHIGDAVIGNLGSKRKMEFTAIGDTVNTTARLESLNKEYGTDIIASGSIVEITSDRFVWRDLGESAIRGRKQAVRIFALECKKQDKSSAEKKENEICPT
ncbi:MAG: adenylate/guanylate cyclase domain-containing protein [Candidatus Riflebacteria bacterium]|nr:adenylate/guanylate cyclase domain-containing protein [Candidatus Riflebacteria bacterium]